MLTILIGVILGIAADRYLVQPITVKVAALIVSVKTSLSALIAKL